MGDLRQRHFAPRGPIEVIQSVDKMALCPLQDPQAHTIPYISLTTPRKPTDMHLKVRVSVKLCQVWWGPKVILGGSGGFCGLHRLVDGVKVSYPRFESPQTAHGDRNGISFSPAFPRGGWGTRGNAISLPVGLLRGFKVWMRFVCALYKTHKPTQSSTSP